MKYFKNVNKSKKCPYTGRTISANKEMSAEAATMLSRLEALNQIDDDARDAAFNAPAKKARKPRAKKAVAVEEPVAAE